MKIAGLVGSVLSVNKFSRKHKRQPRRAEIWFYLLICFCINATVISTSRGATFSWYLAGRTPMSGTTDGPHQNESRLFPFSGVNTTSVDLNYSGNFKVRVKTSSEVQNTTISGGNLQEASATVTVSPMGQMIGQAPFPATLTGTGVLRGVVTVGTNSHHDGSVNFLGAVINPLGDLFFPDEGVYNVSIPLTTTTVPVDSQTGTFPINLSLRSESWGRVGITSGEFEHTLELTSLLLPNGNTPESEGWTLTFDDGSISPNVPDSDYNGDGFVDAADYVALRKIDGTEAGYNNWRTDFGTTVPGSGGTGSHGNGVPEPGTFALLAIGLVAWLTIRVRETPDRGELKP